MILRVYFATHKNRLRTAAISFLIAAFTTSAQQDSMLDSSTAGSSASAIYQSGSNTILDFYQKYISPIKGGNTCPMYPSCSQYAKILFEQESPQKAFIDICDRLLRCARDRESYPEIALDGRLYSYDMPTGNHEQNEIRNDATDEIPYVIDTLNSDIQTSKISFAEKLFQNGIFNIASQEFLKTALSDTDSVTHYNSTSKYFTCEYYLCNAQEFRNICHQFSFLTKNNTALQSELLILLAKKYCTSGLFQNSLSTLALLGDAIPQGSKNNYFSIKSIDYARLYSFQKAVFCAESISGQSNYHDLKDSVISLYSHSQALRSKSSFTAAILSTIIPGSGYIYAKRPSTGALAFLINGLFIWVTAEMFQNHNYAAGTTAALLGSGWYFGNIRGSAKAAHQYNLLQKERLISFTIGDFKLLP
jgi:putative component of membrane protein insertase Oxa1/YidC/SpoIIIJ protein YidD